MMITPVLQVGASVDDYLRREGALAQAVDRCTVLLSSEVAHMRPRDRRLILLHELAHLHERHHNERFTGFLDLHLPQWRTLREELNGSVLAEF